MTDLDEAVKRLEKHIELPGAPLDRDIRTVLDALSEAQSQRDELNRMHRECHQQRDEALAVIERAKAATGRALDRKVWREDGWEAPAIDTQEAHDILNATPVDALRAVKAEKFAEGVQHQWTHRPLGNRSPDNPYREKEQS